MASFPLVCYISIERHWMHKKSIFTLVSIFSTTLHLIIDTIPYTYSMYSFSSTKFIHCYCINSIITPFSLISSGIQMHQIVHLSIFCNKFCLCQRNTCSPPAVLMSARLRLSCWGLHWKLLGICTHIYRLHTGA